MTEFQSINAHFTAKYCRRNCLECNKSYVSNFAFCIECLQFKDDAAETIPLRFHAGKRIRESVCMACGYMVDQYATELAFDQCQVCNTWNSVESVDPLDIFARSHRKVATIDDLEEE